MYMVHIIKSDGSEQEFLESKILSSIERSGVPEEMRQKVLDHIHGVLFEGITTSEIHNHIREFLYTSHQPSLVVKYDLKHAIMNLGPTGYPFEDYIAKLLTHKGFSTQTRTIVRGKCVSHEIDVIATKDSKTTMVEAKFHNGTGITTDVHVALYTQARFQDAKDHNKFDNVMLITNTRISADAIAYGACMGMDVISWSYPDKNSLRDWIENLALYPITALTALTNSQKAQLMQHDIVLCQDLCKNPDALSLLALSAQQKEEIMAEAAFACAR